MLEDRYAPAFGVVEPYGFGPSVVEGNTGTTTLQFEVAYFGDCTDAFTVDYETSDITAQAGSDYQAASGTLQFNGSPGQILQVSVTVNGDSTTELDETVRFSLANVSNAEVEIGEPTTGTIENDDQSVAKVVGAVGQDPEVTEGTSTQFFSVREYAVILDNPVDVAVTVRLNAEGTGADPATPGTTPPAAGVDFYFEGNNRELVVPAGQTIAGWVKIVVIGDAVPEYDEDYRVFVEEILSSGRDVIPGSDMDGKILDDDLANYTPNVVISDAQVTEGNSGPVEIRFTVRLLNDIVGGVDVTVKSKDGWSAERDVDFEIKQDVLKLGGPYPMSKDFVVEVYGDTDREAHEKFYALIENAESITWPGQHQPFTFDLGNHGALGTINNDDEGPYTTAQNVVAVYHGTDGTMGPHFTAAGLRWGTDAAFNVASWGDAISQLEAWVATNGRIALLYLFDHGNPTLGQQMGTLYVPFAGYEPLAPLFDDNGMIILGGCCVANAPAVDGGKYSDFVADDAAPGVFVESSTTNVTYNSGTGEYWGQFVTFNGIEAPPPEVTP